MRETKFPELVGEIAKHGETQTKIANMLGISNNALWRRLTGRTEWTINEIDILCEHYNRNYHELFKRKID